LATGSPTPSDWNISRNRFWGSCIPVWALTTCADEICVGSIAELEPLTGVRVDRPAQAHRIDHLTLPCPRHTASSKRRIPEVLDCWFESGAMPYAQITIRSKTSPLRS
jgi:isoleucyl-tRNA synthetase